jgi:subtilisin
MPNKKNLLSKRNLIVAGVIIVGALVWAFVAGANSNGSRYLVSGDAAGLVKARQMVGAPHHDFDGDFSADLTLGQVRALEALGVTVSPVELYYVLSKPSGKPGGGGGDTSRQYFPSDQTPWGIERVYNDPALVSTSGGAGVDVAVLDTGVKKEHPDLARRVVQCKDFTPPLGMKTGSCKDGFGHGTHVAGTILADGGADGKGIYGVAPAANLWAYKVCGNSGSCWADDIAAAIRHAADQGAEIVSMSLGGDSQSSLIRDAGDYATAAGVLLVAAAGNDGPLDGSIDYPGANAKVIAVGATDFLDSVASWSSRGINNGNYIVEEREVEFGAPGVSVESAWNDGSYRVISGTSMATPHVSGLAAKLWKGSAAATRDYLHLIAQDIWTIGDDTATGFGLPHL